MDEIYIKLDEEDFKCLIRGGVLSISHEKQNKKIRICLSDIGFNTMHDLIEHYQGDHTDFYKDRER